MESSTPLEQYALIKTKISALEAELDQLKPAVLEEVIKQGGKIVANYGTFNVSSRSTWSYESCPEVIEAKEKAKIAEINAQESGLANKVETKTLTFKGINI